MFDIVTIGSATKDIFLRSREFKLYRSEKFRPHGLGIGFPLGSKVHIDKMIPTTGGGGTNTAVTFARMGFKAGFLGKIGADTAGRHVLEELERENVNTNHVKVEKPSKDPAKHTGYSTVLHSQKGERTILVYRGANANISLKDLPKRIRSKWIFISPLSGQSTKLINPLIKRHKNTKIALNPSMEYIKKGIPKNILKHVDVLILNRDEASQLTRISFHKTAKICTKLHKMTNMFVLTEGRLGLKVSDGMNVYGAGIHKSKVVDSLGAGDAFGSGFVAGLMMKNDVEYAMQLGSANASSVIMHLNAKDGILHKKSIGPFFKRFGKLKIHKLRL